MPVTQIKRSRDLFASRSKSNPNQQKLASSTQEQAKPNAAHNAVSQTVGEAKSLQSPKSAFIARHKVDIEQSKEELNKLARAHLRNQIAQRQSAVTKENGQPIKTGYLAASQRVAIRAEAYASLAPLALPEGRVPHEAWLEARAAEGKIVGAGPVNNGIVQWVAFDRARVPAFDPNKKNTAREAVQRAIPLLRKVYPPVSSETAVVAKLAKPATRTVGQVVAPVATSVAAPAPAKSYLSDKSVKNLALAGVREQFTALDPKNKYGIKVKTVHIQDGKISGIEIFKAGSKTRTKTLPFPAVDAQGIADVSAWKGTRLRKACGSDEALTKLFKKIASGFDGQVQRWSTPLIVPNPDVSRKQEMENALASLDLAVEILTATAAAWNAGKVGKDIRGQIFHNAYLRSDVQDDKYALPNGEEAEFLKHYQAGTLKGKFFHGKLALEELNYIPALVVEAFRGLHKYMLNQNIDLEAVKDFLGSAGSMVQKEITGKDGKKSWVKSFDLNPGLDKSQLGKILGENADGVFGFYKKVEEMITALVAASGKDEFKDFGKNIYILLFRSLGQTTKTMSNALSDLLPEEKVTQQALMDVQAGLAHPSGALTNDIFHHLNAYFGKPEGKTV